MRTQDINVENPKIGKTTRVHKPQETESLWWKGLQIRDSEATTLSSSSSTNGGRVTNSYTITLSHTQLQRQQPSLTILQWSTTLYIKFALVVYILIQLSSYLQIWPRTLWWTPSPKLFPNSPMNSLIQIISLLASAAAIYSASVVDSATTFWSLDYHETGPPA